LLSSMDKCYSIGLIFIWFAGDLGKTLYFILKKTPIQFILCGFTQIIIDLWILLQIHVYGGTEYKEVNSNKPLKTLRN